MPGQNDIETTIDPRPRDIGVSVGRVLPAIHRRQLGPFVFFDHIGPATLNAGQGIDVRPHPHINLATVTYLFEGELLHRDSLGVAQVIRPGDINWMTAGRGIVHSERSPDEARARDARIHGVQLWVGLPAAHEEVLPTFHHHPVAALPELDYGGARIKVLVGSAYGHTSPVHTLSPMFYVDAIMPAGTEIDIPGEYRQRALYLASGSVQCGAEPVQTPQMLVLATGANPRLRARTDARVVMLGGEPLDGERHLDWNFVSSRPTRIAQAKADWKAGRFPKVPGDEDEFIPLPD